MVVHSCAPSVRVCSCGAPVKIRLLEVLPALELADALAVNVVPSEALRYARLEVPSVALRGLAGA